jgi:AraC-like DNA-binding protein
LHHLHLLRSEEELPRVAHVCLPSASSFVALTASDGSPILYNGIELRAGDLLVHARGERFFQRTTGPCAWILMAVAPEHLHKYAEALSGKMLRQPRSSRILCPPARDLARLRRLSAQACRLALTDPKMLAHSEIAHALEQGLTHALVTCLAACDAPSASRVRERRAEVMLRFEEMRAEHPDRPSSLRELCSGIGVGERTLRTYCRKFLGVAPGRYMLLQRLKRARISLRDADPGTTSVAAIARDCGFTELGRFAQTYRGVFGESPSTTLRRASAMRTGRTKFSEFA